MRLSAILIFVVFPDMETPLVKRLMANPLIRTFLVEFLTIKPLLDLLTTFPLNTGKTLERRVTTMRPALRFEFIRTCSLYLPGKT
jgi:hypothetical protein